MKMKIINVSGHRVNQDGIDVVMTVPVPTMPIDEPAAIAQFAEKVSRLVEAALATEERVYVVLPGASVLAAHLLAAIAGRTGSFPRIAWAVRDEGRYVFTENYTADLYTVRMAARAQRE